LGDQKKVFDPGETALERAAFIEPRQRPRRGSLFQLLKKPVEMGAGHRNRAGLNSHIDSIRKL
jgi:hypothetical protein